MISLNSQYYRVILTVGMDVKPTRDMKPGGQINRLSTQTYQSSHLTILEPT
jgi:hypothetical protein